MSALLPLFGLTLIVVLSIFGALIGMASKEGGAERPFMPRWLARIVFVIGLLCALPVPYVFFGPAPPKSVAILIGDFLHFVTGDSSPESGMIIFPVLSVSFGLGLGLIMGASAVLWQHSQVPLPGRCPKCRYDLRGLRETRCPECGRAFDPAKVFPTQDAGTQKSKIGNRV